MREDPTTGSTVNVPVPMQIMYLSSAPPKIPLPANLAVDGALNWTILLGKTPEIVEDLPSRPFGP